jgi:hypothetical protein
METLRYSLPAIEQRHPVRISVRGWLAMVTGLNLAFAICMLVCKPPWPHGLSWSGRLQTGTIYIALSCIAGAFGNWIAMRRGASGELSILLRGALRGWIFLPSVALLLQRQSVLAQLIASAAAVLMAMYLFPFTSDGATPFEVNAGAPFQRELFETEVQISSSSWTPVCISVLWVAAVTIAAAGRMMIATLCLATATYLLALQVANALKKVQKPGTVQDREERVYILMTAAFLCVLLGLSNPAILRSPLFIGLGRLAAPKIPTIQPRENSSFGYHTIVLWPLEKEKKTVLRLPVKSSLLAPGVAEPLVIPFYGPYWYFKFAGETPGKDARLAKGDPLKVKIQSTDRFPLLMEAHQRLAEPIETARCGEMRVVVTNDANLGAIAVGITVTDSSSKRNSALNLGVQHGSVNASGQTEEIFTFSFPKRSSLEKFDAITVSFLPDAQHATYGRKVAVEKFVIVPR